MISANQVHDALGSLKIPFQREENQFVHISKGRFAPQIHVVMNVEDDGSSVTIMAALPELITDKRKEIIELLNLCHGQSLWNVRFHLDEQGQLFTVGKVFAWGKPFNELQFGDVFFSLIVSIDRLWPCLVELRENGQSVESAFDAFFSPPPGNS